MSTRPATAAGQPARPASPRASAMTKGRQADSARRRQRVIAALSKAAGDGTEISVAGIARAAGFSELKAIIDIDHLMAVFRTHGERL
jgi:hypothetical protein